MDRKSLAIGIPTFGSVSTRWALAYQALALPMNARVRRVVEQGSEIGIARNRIVTQVLAMEPCPTHLFFLDDDVIPATQWPILRLLSHDRDIVAGVYFSKGHYGEPLVFPGPGQGTLAYNPLSDLLPVWIVPMGLTLIRTELFARIRDEIDLGTDDKGNPNWFHTSGDNPGEIPETEDSWFCKLAHKIGVTPHIDMSPEAFGWHFDLASQTGYPSKQWESYVNTGAVDWEIPD